MADVNKAHQLSAARKKLREYQKHRKSKPNENGTPPAESPTDSTHSSSNEAPPANVSPLQNYFNRDAHAHKETASFFDDDNFAPPHPQESNSTSPKAEDEDVLTIEDPEVNPNMIYDHLNRGDDVDEDSCKGDDDGGGASNMESLKQLSTQIIRLIDDGDLTPQKRQRPHEFDDSPAAAAALQKEKDARAESESRLRLLEADVSQREEANALRLAQLEEQLACHRHTVSILVAEKAELTTASAAARSKTAECEELGARLKTSRSRVADLEKELNVLKLEKSRRDERGHREYAELKVEHEALKERQEEALQDISELRGKLSACLAENAQLRRDLQDSHSKLSVLGVRLQQLSTAENAEATGQIEDAMGRNAVLEKEIVDLHGTIKTLTGERDQASLQYQRYVQQLNNHTSLLAQNLEAKAEENEALVLRVRQLTDQMGELEKMLQRLGERKSFPVGDAAAAAERQQLDEAMRTVEELRGENASLEEKYGRAIGEREELSREVENKRGEVARLEEAVSEMREDRPDNARLLASIESDKVAASRAVAQNAELKRQLEEMQEVFIKMSNDKLELTEKLAGEQHKGKDLHERLDQFESQIHTLTDAIEIKDREMVSLRESAADLNKYVLQQNQLEDRLRHYEAHDHSTHALQFELQESYKRIQHLKIENEKLETRIENMEKRRGALDGVDRVALQNKIDELERINEEIETKLTRNNNNNDLEEGDNPDDSILSRESAMAHLEEKFARTMHDIANLQDEKQRLEHLVLQLQSETETIGEYVALYQHQRGVLKQRALEREEQMKQLTSDREMMKNKLDRLNRLIKALLVEKKGGNSSDLLDREIISASKLCAEHAKLHEEEVQNGGTPLFEAGRSETAEKIIELLGEIKTSNLVQPLFESTSESFHPCPWCSGQLITV